MNAFLISTILLDRRPVRRVPAHYPSVTVLVACYNEGGNIEHTIDSLAQQGYPGAMTVLVLDDGSTDDSVERARAAIDGAVLRPGHAIRLVRGERNVRSGEHTSELQSLMRISYAVFCLKKKKRKHT